MPASSTMRSAASASAAARASPTARAARVAPPVSRSVSSPHAFEANGSQRKTLLKRNADVEGSACRPVGNRRAIPAAPPLPLATRHPGGGMAGMDEDDYSPTWSNSRRSTARTSSSTASHPRRTAARGQADRRLPDRPADRRPVDDLQLLRRRRATAPGLGNFIIMDHILRAPAMRGCPTSISVIG